CYAAESEPGFTAGSSRDALNQPVRDVHVMAAATTAIPRRFITLMTPRFGSALIVLVVAPPPDSRLVAPLGGAVEPLIHAPEAIQSTRIGRIGMVDDAVLDHERAHARPLARVGERVGSAHGRHLGDRSLLPPPGVAPDQRRARLALVVVFDAS